MKIAVTYDSNGQVFQHFGQSQAFKVYEVEDNKVVSSEVIGTNGQGHGALVGLLAAGGITALICGGIGGGAQQMLAGAGITLYAGVSGSCDEAVAALLAGTLSYQTAANCDHHGHEHGGECGGHSHGQGCGGNGHGRG